MIRFTGVSFAYGRGPEVLRGADLDLGTGLCLVLGPNGCGKSTLLKLAAGVEAPTAGRITIAGHDLWREEVAARRLLAYLPEHPDLTPYATLGEVLRLVCGLRGEPPAAAGLALRWVGLEGLEGRTVRELSKGQRRRATLAAAHIGSPPCLLLDEPFNGMDRGFCDTLLAWIGERVAAGATTLVVAHDFEPLAGLAARAVTVTGGGCRPVDPLPEEGPERTRLLDDLARGRQRW